MFGNLHEAQVLTASWACTRRERGALRGPRHGSLEHRLIKPLDTVGHGALSAEPYALQWDVTYERVAEYFNN